MDIKTIQSGLWSDPNTWDGGKLPLTSDKAIINHVVIIDTSEGVAGVEINNTLSFKIDADIELVSSGNIIVNGVLQMVPNPDVDHSIRFRGIDENKFVGGGETVLDSDIGMWVMGNGQLMLQGGRPFNWNPGGDIVNNIGAIIQSADEYLPNIIISGSLAGYSHIFIKSTQPQTIKYIGLRYMGPRKDRNNDGVKELVTGRYAIHFHHAGDGSRGSLIHGVLAKDCNNHCFVPHGSHGITMRNNVALNVLETPFWYDLGHKTNDLLWENNLVAKVGFVERSLDQDSSDAPTFGVGGFALGFGDGNTCRGNVVYQTSGDPRVAGAFYWPEIRNNDDNTLQLESQWTFDNNIAIECPAGEQVWQNNNYHHINRNSTLVRCQVPIYHGAYQNDYCRKGGYIKGGYVDVRAASATTNRLRFEDMTFDADGGDYCVQINEGPLDGAAPILFRNCKFINYKKAAIINQNPGPGLKTVDVIDCGLQPNQYAVTASKSGEFIRVQEAGKAWKITRSGTTQISLFAPTSWGAGNGLKAEYYSPDWKTKYLERIEPNINLFDLTHPSPYYTVPTTFAARWTGKIQPQITGIHTFTVFAGGGVRLWVNNQLLLDKWDERYPGEATAKTISLVAGLQYDIKLEFFNNDDRSGCMLYWAAGIIKKEFVPMSQLCAGVIPPPPDNKPPTANAGADQQIEVSTTLYGTGIDPEGKPVTFKWEQTKGVPAVIVNPSDPSTKITGLSQGENVFNLTVTDEKGASGSDEVVVMVQ